MMSKKIVEIKLSTQEVGNKVITFHIHVYIYSYSARFNDTLNFCVGKEDQMLQSPRLQSVARAPPIFFSGTFFPPLNFF